jgi:DNA-binding response OmpR family regulator
MTSSSPRILVVDDDAKTTASVRLYLEHAGFSVIAAAEGSQALAMARSAAPDLVVLDLMLPGIGGLEVCRRLRAESAVPIIMLTARSTEEDRLTGLDLGADDYVVKPFSPRELMARIRAQLRRHRSPSVQEPVLVADGLRLDPNRARVEVDGQEVELTATEFRLLHALMRHPARVLSRDELIDAVHGDRDAGIIDRTVDVHVGRLRRKLRDPAAQPRFVDTVRSMGYRFSLPVARLEAEAS